ncbi:nucleotidyltransferase domain-containing protein [archaeon]|nr:MAG: nucleotidyltransferase domain-containing protein [archaeon]
MSEKIKEVILDTARKYNVEVEKIILFGSRAKGDHKKGSDWDIMVVTKNEIRNEDEDKFWMEIDKKLVELGIIPELIVVPKEIFEKHKRPAYVFYYAEKEGTVLYQD